MAEPRGRLAIISLGANLGDRADSLAKGWAAVVCELQLRAPRMSSVIWSAPAEGAHGDEFANAVGCGWCAQATRDVVLVLQRVERAFGRDRKGTRGAPRTLDLDLIALGAQCHCEAGIAVPHPRYRQRDFVLRPLAELLPDFVDPHTGESVAALLGRLERPGSAT